MKVALLFFSFNLFAETQVQVVTTCKNGNCSQETITTSNEIHDLDLSKVNVGDCLLDPKTDRVYQVEMNDLVTKKFHSLVQDVTDKNVIFREQVYTDTLLYNPRRVKVSCSGTVFEQEYLKKCISFSGKYTKKIYCSVPKKRAF